MQASEVDNFNDVLLGQTYARTASGQTYAVPAGRGGTQWVDPLLKLEYRKGQVDVVVVDHVEKLPVQN